MGDTRAVLRTRARALADQDASEFPSDAQYNQWLDDAKKDVWFDLVTAGWPVNYATQTLTATGAAQYALASGAAVTSVRAVYLVQGGQRTLVERIDETQKAAILSQPLTGEHARYEVLTDPSAGTVVRFYPLVSGTFEVEYIAETGAFASDADTWFGPAGSDQMICLLAAAKGCRKEGRRGDAADLLQDYAIQLEKVLSRANWVDQRNVPRIRDVMGARLRDTFDFNATGPDTY
jgi:hypothetical protein